MTTATPKAEIAIDEALVHTLLAAQHPDLATWPLAAIDAGWDNATFRLGETLAVRLPRREAAATLIVNEQDWLGVLAPWLTLPTPAPVLKALHKPAPASAPANAARGVPLQTRAASVEERLARLKAETSAVTPGVIDAWRAGLAATTSTEARWLHGDLHPRNVLVRDGALSGFIDWGDITSGDIATDLASFWMLFEDRTVRDAALKQYGASAADVARARAWAVLFGAVLLDTGRIDTPRHAIIGASSLARVAAG